MKPMLTIQDRAVILKNRTCPYCAVRLAGCQEIDKEHVIGRNFVPRGTLENQFNLIFSAHRFCNRVKANLEDDIGAIALSTGNHPNDQKELVENELSRKLPKSQSRSTGRPVADSNVSLSLPLIESSQLISRLGFVGPPQVDEKRIQQLAMLHFRAFTYYLTFDSENGLGYVPEKFGFVGAFNRRNWGAQKARWFMDLQQNWSLELLVNPTAMGFFRLAIRACPVTGVGAYSVEWNNSIRVLAFFGDEIKIKQLASTMPAPRPSFQFQELDGSVFRGFEEVGLAPEEDTLFGA